MDNIQRIKRAIKKLCDTTYDNEDQTFGYLCALNDVLEVIDDIEGGTETYNAPFYYVFRTANSCKNN